MNPKDKNEEAIFYEAIEIGSPEERDAYVKGACEGNPRLFDRLKALVKSHEQESSFLQPPPDTVAPIELKPVSEGPGTTIGPYKLLQQIGEGGFGVVYMAQQQQPVRRQVALKIIKPGMDTKQVVARFEAERQALALMEHPNIARVFDAGTTDSGRPYFVMELVKGIPLTDYCDKNNLATRERLQLFVMVCQAVQHAHQKGVIHRDLKPSNVMVTLHDGHPVPKVIDFGVSKAISQQLTEKTLFTAYGQMIGTPQYMSPEQAEMSGLDVDTRSDVYSLGVLLYELLTGTTPLENKRLNTLAYVEMQRVIREEEPPRPSARLSTMGGELTMVAKHRSTDAKRLPQLVRGDLDWIVMKALSKERGRRYESANSFASDVQRHLSDETIEARPPSTAYQMTRLVRRHKGPVTAAAAILLVLLLGIAGTTTGLVLRTQQKRRAEAEAYRAIEAEKVALEAEGQARANLEKSEKLSDRLSKSLAQLSDVTVRFAVQTAYALIEENRPQDGLLWLQRALEYVPEGDTSLEREIRAAMSIVSDDLPRPEYVLAPEEDETFSRFGVSHDGKRLLVLITADPPEQPDALGIKVVDVASGATLSTIDVPPSIRSAIFSPDGETVYACDSTSLHRYSVTSGAELETAYSLSQVLPSNSPLFSERAALNPTTYELFVPRLVAVDPAGETILLGYFNFIRIGSEQRVATRIGLLNLETDHLQTLDRAQDTNIRGRPVQAAMTRDGKTVLVTTLAWGQQFGTRPRHRLQAWDVVTGKLREDGEVTLPVGPRLLVVDPVGTRAIVSSSQTAGTTGQHSLLQLLDLEDDGAVRNELLLDGQPAAMTFSPSGEQVAVIASSRGTLPRLTIWDLTTNQSEALPIRLSPRGWPIFRLALPRRPMSPGAEHVTFGPDGQTVLCSNGDQVASWRLPPRRQRAPDFATPASVTELAFVADGRELVTVTEPHSSARYAGRVFGARGAASMPRPLEIQRWDITAKRPIGRAFPIAADIATVSPDGRLLVTASGRKIQRWDMASMTKVGPPLKCRRPVARLELTADGKTLVSESSRSSSGIRPSGSLRVTYYMIGAGMSPANPGLRAGRILPGTPAEAAGLRVNDIVIEVDGTRVDSLAELRQHVDLDNGQGVELTLLRDGKEQKLRLRPQPRPDDDLRKQLDSLRGWVQLWDMETGTEVSELPIPMEGESVRAGNDARYAAASPDGKVVVTASKFDQRSELRVFDARTGRPIARSVECRRPIQRVYFGPRGRTIATVDTTEELQIWHADDLKRVGPRIQPGGLVSDLAFSADGETLLMTTVNPGEGRRISLWDTRTSRPLGPPAETSGGGYRLACSPNGTLLATTLEGHVWLDPLPQAWPHDSEKSKIHVEAFVGRALTASGDIESLEADRWQQQLAQTAGTPGTSRIEARPSVRRTSWDLREDLDEPDGNDPEAMLSSLDDRIKREPENWTVRLRRVALLLNQSRFDEATVGFGTARELATPDRIKVWLRRQAVPPRSRSTPRSRPTGSDSPAPGGANQEGKVLWCCDLLLEDDPHDPLAHLLRTTALVNDGRWDEAEAAIAAALATEPRQLMLENLRSVAQTKSGSAERSTRRLDQEDPARARWILDHLISAYPNNWELLLDRANLTIAQEEWGAAAGDIDQAVAVGPAGEIAATLYSVAGRSTSRVLSRVSRGIAVSLDDIREASLIWEKIHQIDPSQIGAATYLASLYGRLAQWEQAAETLTKLTELTPDNHWPQYQLAPVFLKLGQTDRYQELCRGMLQQFDRSAGSSPERRAIRACLWHAETVDDWSPLPQTLQTRLRQRADSISPATLAWRQTDVGIALYRAGDEPASIEWLQKAIDSGNLVPRCELRALCVLAMAFHNAGDKEEASETLQRAARHYEDASPQPGVEDLGSHWHGWVIGELLLSEAKAVVGAGEEMARPAG